MPASVLLLALLLALAPVAPVHGSAMDRVSIGGVAPEAAGLVLQGPENIRLSALRGRIVVVDFWASWCTPCLESMPKLDALRRRLHSEGHAESFEVLAIAVDKDVALARRFLAARPVSYPVVADPLGVTLRSFKVWRLPASYIIHADGRVSMIYYGYGPSFVDDVETRVRDRSLPSRSKISCGLTLIWT